MGSVFLNVGLVAGVALAALPVILHLFMKQTPKHVIFPALRLIQERQKRSRKRLRVKNWLLLLARMGLLALMALALARPRIDARASLGTGEEPTAVALVFDTSLSMGYKVRDLSRLDDAKERAQDVIKKLNEQSKVFILDGSDPSQPIAQSPAAAKKKVEGLTIRAVNRTLNAAMGAAYTAVAEVELPRREVYVFTDLAASQWQSGQEVDGLAEARKRVKGGEISTFVLRVGAKEMRDVAILSAETASPVATENQPVILKVKLRNLGPKTTRIVNVRLDGRPIDKKLVEIPAGSEVDVPRIATPKLGLGLHRIEIGLDGEPDPLAFDDSHFLTIDVQPAMKILLISEVPEDADFVEYALAPQDRPQGLAWPFQIERVRTSQMEAKLRGRTLKEFAGIFLLNVRGLEPFWWDRLGAYVRDGGGLVVAPAGYADVTNYNQALAAQIMPAMLGKILTHKQSDTPFGFGTPDLSSPLFAVDTKDLLGDLARASVLRSREVTVDPKSHVVLRYTDDTPAVIERTFPGSRPGKVMLWTTALSTRASESDPQYWNDMPKSGWAFLVMMDQTAYYLAGASGQKFLFEAGEDAVLPLDPTRQFVAATVQGPNTAAGERQGEFAGRQLLVASPGALGQWSVKVSGKDGPPVEMGFSVNPPRGELQTTTMEPKDLDTLFGKAKYQLADDAASLKIAVGTTRYGREIFPYIMALILILVTLENLLANTFYREKTTATAIPARA